MKLPFVLLLFGSLGLGQILNTTEEDPGGSIQDEFAISIRDHERSKSLAAAEPELARTELAEPENGVVDEVVDRR